MSLIITLIVVLVSFFIYRVYNAPEREGKRKKRKKIVHKLQKRKARTSSTKVLPQEGKRNVLITSALPYVNNVPHLGNIIGCVLSGDVFSRYCRSRGYQTLYICGSDEYGTATEKKAKEEGVTPSEICAKYRKIHEEIYKWFRIDFDYFGRTSTEKQTEIAQSIFLDLHRNGLLCEKKVRQFFCSSCEIFLADRYVNGECPHCHNEDARGGQCEKCGQIIDAIELLKPLCSQCRTKPLVKSSDHLFLDLPAVNDELKGWSKKSIGKGKWSEVAKSITKGWIKDGVKERCITRDLKWGTPVPLEKYKDKVFYVWFDAPIGYISITANYTDNWEDWWFSDDEYGDGKYDVEYFQFLGKDNVPFHSIIFPATLMGTGRKWKLVDSLCSTHYLNYEEEKFSKSRGVGVFGNQAKETDIPCEVWRYYLLANRPELNDTKFFWNDLAEKNNNELLKNLGNFCNRALKFCKKNWPNGVPQKNGLEESDKKLKNDVDDLLKEYINHMEDIKIKDGLKDCLGVSRLGNQYFQENKPWVSFKNDKKRCETTVNIAINLVVCVASVIQPYLPSFVEKILDQLGIEKTTRLTISDQFDMDYIKPGHKLGNPTPLFKKLTDDDIEKYHKKFGGKKID